MYNAPLCYPGICDASEALETTVEIFVKRMLAVEGDSDNATNVWVLQGGPGDSSTATQTMTTGSPFGSKIDPLEVPACAQDLQFKYGDLASFSVTSAATDITTLISNYTNGANTTVYGVSYGTALVERLLHLNPPTVTGYVLDSIATSSGAPADKCEYFSTWNIDYGEVGDRFLALCEQDDECAARFEPNGLKNTLQNVLMKFDKDPNSTCASLMYDVISDLRNEPPSLILRGALSALLGRLTLRKLIPPIVYRLNRCTPKDVEVLAYFISVLNEDTAFTSQDDAFYSPLLYYLIIFSEMWESPSPSIEEMRARFTNARISDSEVYMDTPLYCAFSKENSTVCNELNVSSYFGNGIVYEHDQYWNKSARIPEQASVLLLNGKLDPMTPYKYAEYLLEALDGGNKELFTFDYSVHDTISSTLLVEDGDSAQTCGLNLLVSYVKNNGDLEQMNRSCGGEQPEFNLTAPTEIVAVFMSTDDAYDGIYESIRSSSDGF
ncbi:hypothetical protein JG687_00016354 [Phytophthora cactorum]|uniref:Peptidase S33 tripeptidyl aminopeptidase-like C-terminal domain-containing protein n=1 Tax=Phytophthora cactorum TaxID=29920 RepID=A0A8T1TUP2_9STRA|nr:hypothetical protein JG687_00016354 [Phytophthora cactorum]